VNRPRNIADTPQRRKNVRAYSICTG
jgi:hypothetical protein